MLKSAYLWCHSKVLVAFVALFVSLPAFADEPAFSYPTSAGLVYGTYSSTPGNFWYFPVTKPSGATVQWMSFYWWSDNYLAQVPPYEGAPFGGQHLAAGTRMDINYSANSISGIGLAMGPGSTSIGGCGILNSAAQVEQWEGSANALISSTCSGGGTLSDGVVYKILIGSNDAGYIYYEVRNVSTNAVVASYSYLGTVFPTGDRLLVNAVAGVINDVWAVSIWGMEYGWY